MLANATGIALGNVRNVISGLEDAGYVLQVGQKMATVTEQKGIAG